MAQVQSKERHRLPEVLRQHSTGLPDEQWQSKGLLKMAADVIDSLSAQSETQDSTLTALCKELGWQGGTRHQALAEVENLRLAKAAGLTWAEKLKAMTAWLDEHQPDVWRRGLWDAINEAQKRAEKANG